MTFDYRFTQKMINFGRDLGSKFVGQPLLHYRLNSSSSEVVVDANKVVDPITGLGYALKAKISPMRSRTQVESDSMHASPYEFLMSSDRVLSEDILVQDDSTYGDNATFFVASRRPLKKVICVRVEGVGRLYRQAPQRSSGYNEVTRTNDKPFVLLDGVFTIGTPGGEATALPVGVTYIGQIKDQKVTRLPLDTTTTWYYLCAPLFPGLDRVRENDIIEVEGPEEEPPMRYRVHGPLSNEFGLRGLYLLCERMSI